MSDNQEFRIEKDSLGDVQVDANALYAAQTQRAIDNFTISGQSMPRAFIAALLQIKSAAANVNAELGQISQEMAKAIVAACDELLGDPQMMTHFPVDVFQTGSGTSSNMNANEVIATLATRHYQGAGEEGVINANDHVNCGQSSNDVIPTAIHVSASLLLHKSLLPSLKYLDEVTRKKAVSVKGIIKTGRTHLMDAMPVQLSQSLIAWADQVSLNIDRLEQIQAQIQSLGLGGTAVGTGVNSHPEFAVRFSAELSRVTGVEFTASSNFFTHIGTQDIAVALSGQLKACAVSVMKIANDLRWMNSGPLAGLGEIALQALQPGSSIMPGKVNPVIPEAAAMAAAQVMGNDTAITVGGQSGNFELNVMLPMIARNLIESIEILSTSNYALADKAIATFTVNESVLEENLAKNPILITALNPIIGYEKAAKIAKQAYAENRPIIDVADEHTDLGKEELQKLLDPAKLTELETS